jgi:aminoglycoside 3'-phosphotransferase II
VTFGDLLPLLPAEWHSELRASRVNPVDGGMSGTTLYRVQHPDRGDAYLKMATGPHLAALRTEIERTAWLAGRGVRVPRLLRVFDDGQRAAVMMTALAGAHPGDAGLPAGDIIRAVARGLFRLHALAPSDCPFDETVASRLAQARDMMRRGLVAPEHFADRNRGRDPQAIYDRLLRTRPASEDLVLVHGDATFDNILIDADQNIGFIDCGHAGRGDRYLDLAAITEAIADHFGPEWIETFGRAYGDVRLDAAKLAFFSDLYELF